MKTHTDKYIWIIGASSGIGEALARELASQGAKLILTARRKDKLDILNQALGDKHHVLPADAGNATELLEAATEIKKLDNSYKPCHNNTAI